LAAPVGGVALRLLTAAIGVPVATAFSVGLIASAEQFAALALPGSAAVGLCGAAPRLLLGFKTAAHLFAAGSLLDASGVAVAAGALEAVALSFGPGAILLLALAERAVLRRGFDAARGGLATEFLVLPTGALLLVAPAASLGSVAVALAAVAALGALVAAPVIIALSIGGRRHPSCRAQRGQGRYEGILHCKAPVCVAWTHPRK
jgi:hypothetical protein